MARTAVAGTLDVLSSTRKRISHIFDNYSTIQLAFSGGKDSTVLFHLINEESNRRGRRFYLYFQDQEAEYQGTIDMVEWAMSHPSVIPMWYQVPIFMTNAASQQQLFLWAWGEGEQWVREKHDLAIKEIKGSYPKRFHKFNLWAAQQVRKIDENCVTIIGLRAEESPDRRFVMFGEDSDFFWLRRKNRPNKAYPIIDWSYTDVWKYLIEGNFKYNNVYDKMYKLGGSLRSFRVSNLVHEKAFRCLADLQEIEPETYEKLEQRLHGVHSAAMYAREGLIYSANTLPEQFSTWKEYRNFLMSSIHPELAKIFRWQWTRLEHVDEEDCYKYQVKRILLCDWEGNINHHLWGSGKKSGYDVNYTREQIRERNYMRKNDEILRKWLSI